MSMLHKANGAGIAADPTLTSAWSFFPCVTSGEPSVSLFQIALGARCLILPQQAASGFVTGARAGIRYPLANSPITLGRSLLRSGLPLGRNRDHFSLAACNLRAGLLSRSSFLPQSLTRSMVYPMTTLRVPLKRACLLSVETFRMPSLEVRVDKSHRISGT